MLRIQIELTGTHQTIEVIANVVQIHASGALQLYTYDHMQGSPGDWIKTTRCFAPGTWREFNSQEMKDDYGPL